MDNHDGDGRADSHPHPGCHPRPQKQQWDDFLHGSFSFEDAQELSCSKPEGDGDYEAEAMDLMLWSYGLSKRMEIVEGGLTMQRHLNNTTGFRGWCFQLTQKPAFTNGIMALIVVNVACVAFDAEVGVAEVVDPNNTPPEELIELRKVLEHIFTAVFLAEILVRTIGSPDYFWRDAWLMFDSLIVYGAVLDAWILKPASLGGNTGSLGVLRVLRLFRAFRAMRILRLFRFCWPLRVLAESLADAFVGIGWIIVIVAFLTFTVSVVATATVGALVVESDDAVASGDSADDVDGAMFVVPSVHTLFNHVLDLMTIFNYVNLTGLYWGQTMVWPLLFSNNAQEVFLGVLVTFYILCVLILLANLVLGTFVTIIMDAKGRDEQAVTRERLLQKTGHLEKLARVYLDMDVNGDGRISLEEFREGLEDNPKLCQFLGIPMDKVETIYVLANNRFSQGEPASVDDLMIGILKHTSMSRTIDQLSLDHQQQRVRRTIGQVVYHYMGNLQTLRDVLDRVARDLEALQQRFQKLAESLRVQKPPEEVFLHPGENGEDAPRLTALLSHSLERNLLNELDAKYRFKGRLLKVEAGLSQEAAGTAATDGGGALAFAQTIFKGVLAKEVHPWMHHELASLQARQFSTLHKGRTRQEASPAVPQGRSIPQLAPPGRAAPAPPPQREADDVGGQGAGGGRAERPQLWPELWDAVQRIDPASPWFRH